MLFFQMLQMSSYGMLRDIFVMTLKTIQQKKTVRDFWTSSAHNIGV